MFFVEFWKAAAVPWKLPWTAAGTPMSSLRFVDAGHRVAERLARRQVEGDRDGRNLAGMIELSGMVRGRDLGDGGQRHQRAVLAP